MKVAALIIGIDGWEKYTKPLIESINLHEPGCDVYVIDNGSQEPYPEHNGAKIFRTERLCYAAAINQAASLVNQKSVPDWYIVLSNDVVCTGPFISKLMMLGDLAIGPEICMEHGQVWLVGWCVAASSRVWKMVGGWDPNFQVSSWEDVDFSTCVVKAGFYVVHDPSFPFKHLDQRQRFTIIEKYWESEVHNRDYFFQKHGALND